LVEKHAGAEAAAVAAVGEDTLDYAGERSLIRLVY